MANKFYVKEKIHDALFLYSTSRNFSSTIELKRDLSSNISLMFFKLKDYGSALQEAEKCIGYDKSWYKVTQ